MVLLVLLIALIFGVVLLSETGVLVAWYFTLAVAAPVITSRNRGFEIKELYSKLVLLQILVSLLTLKCFDLSDYRMYGLTYVILTLGIIENYICVFYEIKNKVEVTKSTLSSGVTEEDVLKLKDILYVFGQFRAFSVLSVIFSLICWKDLLIVFKVLLGLLFVILNVYMTSTLYRQVVKRWD